MINTLMSFQYVVTTWNHRRTEGQPYCHYGLSLLTTQFAQLITRHESFPYTNVEFSSKKLHKFLKTP